MARSPFPPFAWKTLRRALRDDERKGVISSVKSLLRFQRDLSKWSLPKGAPDATPFVSLYARGALRGCFGSDEGSPDERLARAFLRALDDARFGGVRSDERDEVTAQVSYVTRAKLVNPETAAEQIELGVHGVAVVPEKRAAVLLLPHVARDERVGAAEMLRRLAKKAGIADEGLAGEAIYLLETDDVVVHGDDSSEKQADFGVVSARRWLAQLVDDEGRVTFSIDPRTRTRVAVGEMHHARASVVAHALDAGPFAKIAKRIRSRLHRDASAALAGRSIEGWPRDDAQVAGTLALMVRGGVDVRRELLEHVRAKTIRTAWHCAQVCAVLGRDAPDAIWNAALADLEAHPWAPWTLLGAHARRDVETREAIAKRLVSSMKSDPPHRGAGTITAVPEIALTALAVEALGTCRSSIARSARERGKSFVARAQLVGHRLYGALDPRLAAGAFPASLVVDLLRCDVTAHAVLALET